MNGMSVIVRPWLNAGFKYLLAESEERVRLLSRGATPQGAAEGTAPPAGTGGHAASAERAPRREVPSGTRPAPVRPAPAPALSPPASSVARPRPAASFLPVEKWDAPWQGLWKRLNMDARPRVVWTYAGLGDDLAGQPNDGRRKVLGRILKALGHPRGTHAFWPYMLPEGSVDADVFWSALHASGARALLVFGSDARDALALPKTLRPYCHEMFRGSMVIQLHRLETLAVNDGEMEQVVSYLAALLRRCVPSQG